MRHRLLTAILLNAFSFGYLGSQEVPYLSGIISAPWTNTNWETSFSIPRQDPNFLDAVAVPFHFPMETSLLYSYAKPTGILPGQTSQTYYERASNLSNSSYMKAHSVYGQRSIAYLYRKKNFGLNLDLSLQMAGDTTGLKFMEAGIAKVRMSYRVPNQLLGFHRQQKMDLFLELSELHTYDPMRSGYLNQPVQSTLLKSAENNNRPSFTAKQIYASPGVSLSTSSNFMFEGMVRVPMNSREANRTLDELWTPEIQTNLGMKYIIPVK